MGVIAGMVVIYLLNPPIWLIITTETIGNQTISPIYTPLLSKIKTFLIDFFNYGFSSFVGGLVVGLIVKKKGWLYGGITVVLTTILTGIFIALCLQMEILGYAEFQRPGNIGYYAKIGFNLYKSFLLTITLFSGILSGYLGEYIVETEWRKRILIVVSGIVITKLLATYLFWTILKPTNNPFTSFWSIIMIYNSIPYLIGGLFMGWVAHQKSWIYGSILGFLVIKSVLTRGYLNFIIDFLIPVISGVIGGCLGEYLYKLKNFEKKERAV
ncbi:MAG: hypothetical protein AB1765_13550 [Candidatus Hydrogenedentota bacterium]